MNNSGEVGVVTETAVALVPRQVASLNLDGLGAGLPALRDRETVEEVEPWSSDGEASVELLHLDSGSVSGEEGKSSSRGSSPASAASAPVEPLPFHQLSVGVDLKRAPPNWLQSTLPDGTLVPASVDRSLPLAVRRGDMTMTGGLAMEHVGSVDVVAPVSAMKQLFAMPYSSAPLSLSIHSLGETLILDTVNDGSTPASMGLKQAAHHDRPSAAQVHKQELYSKFLYRSLITESVQAPRPTIDTVEAAAEARGVDESKGPTVTSPRSSPQGAAKAASAVTTEAKEEPVRNTAVTSHPSLAAQLTVPPSEPMKLVSATPPIDDLLPQPPSKFRQVCKWRFNGMNMVLGSDLIVFNQGEHHSRVSLQLQDVEQQPMTQAEGMDMFLENLMASVPEVAMCFHKAGVVKGYRLVATQDIPTLTKEGFSPFLLEQNAVTLLRFLRENCLKDCGTYWLWRGPGDKTVQLYDLSALSGKRILKWKYMMAMLCYKYASQLGRLHEDHDGPQQSSGGRRPRSKSMGGAPSAESRASGARRRELLMKCNELLEEVHNGGGRSHVAIRAAVHAELADSYYLEAMLEDSPQAAKHTSGRSPSKKSRKSRRSSKRNRSSGHDTDGSCSPVQLRAARSRESVQKLNHAARHILLGMQALREVVQKEERAEAAQRAFELAEREGVASGASMAAGVETAVAAVSKRSEEERMADMMQLPSAKRFLAMKQRLVGVTMQLARSLGEEGRPVVALRAMNDALGCMRMPMTLDGISKHIPLSFALNEEHSCSLMELCGKLFMQQAVAAHAAAAEEEGAGGEEGEAITSTLLDDRSVSSLSSGSESDTDKGQDPSVQVGKLRHVFHMIAEVGARHRRRDGRGSGGSPRELSPSRVLGGASSWPFKRRLGPPKSYVDFLFLAARCYAYVASVLVRSRDRKAYAEAVRMFGDATNRWGQTLLRRQQLSQAAEVFQHGVEIFDLVDDKQNSALLTCNIVHILRSVALQRAEAAASAPATPPPSSPSASASMSGKGLVQAALAPSSDHTKLFDTAITLCTRAYNSLSRKKHGSVRRRVTEELAQCHLAHGVHLARLPNMPVDDDIQRQSHQLLARALTLYKEAGNRQQVAACHYQLGHSFFLIVQSFAAGHHMKQEKLRMALNQATSHFDEALEGYRRRPELELCNTLLVIVQDYTQVFALIAKLHGDNHKGKIQAFDGALRTLSVVASLFHSVPEESPPELKGTDKDVSRLWELGKELLPTFRDLLRGRLAASRADNRSKAELTALKTAYLTALSIADAHGIVKLQEQVAAALKVVEQDEAAATS